MYLTTDSIKMLANARSEIVLSSVGADANDTFDAVPSFSLLEQNIDSIAGHLAQIFAPETGQA